VISNTLTNIHWEQVQGVVFDIDGTLYEQTKLRQRMFLELFLHYSIRPLLWREPLILFEFRRIREDLAKSSYEESPERGYEIVAKKFKVSIQEIKNLVDHWFLDRPIHHLKEYLFPGAKEFIHALISVGIKVGVFSDYPGKTKLLALGLPDMLCVSSEDIDVNRLKPNPKGLYKITKQLNIPIDRTLFIGNREDLDGLCASRAGMSFLLFQSLPTPSSFNSYFTLLKELKDMQKGELK